MGHCGAERAENRFFQSGGPDVGSEGFSIDRHIDFAIGFIDDDADVIFFFWRFWLLRRGENDRRK